MTMRIQGSGTRTKNVFSFVHNDSRVERACRAALDTRSQWKKNARHATR